MKTPFTSLLTALLSIVTVAFAISQSVTGTYTSGDIPTSFPTYSSTCNGPLTKISITLPGGGPWTVTGIDITYNMTAYLPGWKSDQRSYVRCQNTSTSESTTYQGTGDEAGTQSYSRLSVDIANGSYPGGAILNFEMRAWRTYGDSGCNTALNQVDNSTWTITIYYSQIPDQGSVGIGTSTPEASALLELQSTSKGFLLPRLTSMERDAIASPVPGLVIFNTSTQNMEVFSSGWKSFNSSAPRVKRLYGGSADDVTYSGQQTSDGGYIAAGYTESSDSGTLMGLMNNGSKDGWIFKLNSTGDIVWQKLYGGSAEDIVFDIRQTSDGGYIAMGQSFSSNSGTLTGIFNNGNPQTSDLWVFKLNVDGGVAWQKLLGGSAIDKGDAIDLTDDGGYIIAGYSESSNSGTMADLTNNGGKDVWIVKLNSGGDTEWQKLYGGSADDFASGIIQDPDGGICVASTSYSSNTGTLTGTFSFGGADYWVLRLSGNGEMVWHRLLGGDMDDECADVGWRSGRYTLVGTSASSNTGTLVGLYNNGQTDGWIIFIDDSGSITGQEILGESEEERVNSLSIDSRVTDDHPYGAPVAGVGVRCLPLPGDSFQLEKEWWFYILDSSGSLLYERLYGGDGDEEILKATTTIDDGAILFGCTTSSDSGDLQGLLNYGGKDSWILKVDKNGNPY